MLKNEKLQKKIKCNIEKRRKFKKKEVTEEEKVKETEGKLKKLKVEGTKRKLDVQCMPGKEGLQ
jgi:hypothetical protein